MSKKLHFIVPDPKISMLRPIPVICWHPEVNNVTSSGKYLESLEQRQDDPLSRQANYFNVGSIYVTAGNIKCSYYKA